MKLYQIKNHNALEVHSSLKHNSRNITIFHLNITAMSVIRYGSLASDEYRVGPEWGDYKGILLSGYMMDTITTQMNIWFIFYWYDIDIWWCTYGCFRCPQILKNRDVIWINVSTSKERPYLGQSFARRPCTFRHRMPDLLASYNKGTYFICPLNNDIKIHIIRPKKGISFRRLDVLIFY